MAAQWQVCGAWCSHSLFSPTLPPTRTSGFPFVLKYLVYSSRSSVSWEYLLGGLQHCWSSKLYHSRITEDPMNPFHSLKEVFLEKRFILRVATYETVGSISLFRWLMIHWQNAEKFKCKTEKENLHSNNIKQAFVNDLKMITLLFSLYRSMCHNPCILPCFNLQSQVILMGR